MSDTYDLVIYQGLPFDISLNIKNDSGNPLNLSGYNLFSSNIREKYGDSGILAQLSGTFSNPLESGNLSLSLTTGQTLSIPVTQGVYNVEIYNTGTQTPLMILNGYVTIVPTV